jgi:membrane protease YdiL (CAAX protease family)
MMRVRAVATTASMIVLRSVIVGLFLAAAGTIPWSFLAGWNLRVFVTVPWAIVPTALYLVVYWRYLNGAGWPQATAERRRRNLRANGLPGEVWGMALFAGLLGLAALLPLLGVMSRLTTLPAEARPISTPPDMPFATVLLLLATASIVSGVVEESAFRGYMQGPIERKLGPLPAILAGGAAFGLAHYTHHPAAVLPMMPYYVAVSAVYGGLAYATNSILPGLVLHAGGNVFSLTRLWVTGQPEWQVTGTAPPLIWESRADAVFLSSAAAFVFLSAGAVWAYRELARVARGARDTRSR